MSSPTGSDPNYPQGGGPQGGQPGWSPPPPPSTGYDPQGYTAPNYAPHYAPAPSYGGGPATGERPGTVTAAAIIGIVWGVLGALFALVLMLGAFALSAPLVGVILLLGLALYVGLIVAGVQALQGRSPRLLLMLSYVAIGLSLLQFVVSLVASGGNGLNGVLGIVIPGVIVFLLLQPRTKEHYAARGISY